MKGFKKFVEEKKITEAVDQKVVIHTKNGKVSSIEQGTYMPNGVFIGNAGVNFDKGFIGMDPEDAKASLIKWSKYSPDKIIIESNSWTTADGSKIEVTSNKVFRTTKDGKKYWMPRYTWEHAFDDDGDIENGPSRREPNWLPVKEDTASRVKAAQEFEAKTGISPEDFEAYEDVRQSGVTNMFDVRTVMELSGLSRDMIMKIMKNYSEAKKVYGE